MEMGGVTAYEQHKRFINGNPFVEACSLLLSSLGLLIYCD